MAPRSLQVRTISVSRISAVVGWLGAKRMAEVDEALRLHVAL